MIHLQPTALRAQMLARKGMAEGGMVWPVPWRARNAMGTPPPSDQSARGRGAGGLPKGGSMGTIWARALAALAAMRAVPRPEPPMMPIRGDGVDMRGF